MKIQNKNELFGQYILRDIIKALAVQFYQYNCVKWPRQLIFYLDGLSEGNADKVKEHEMSCIRKTFHELKKLHNPDYECPNAERCDGNGCRFCTPLTTYMMCTSQHNMRIVLHNPHDGQGKSSSGRGGKNSNVFSGTCVDDTIVNFKSSLTITDDNITHPSLQLFSDVDDSGRSFVLTAQGGLKGTSKPIIYTWLENENLRYFNESGTTPLEKEKLEWLTYHMSYQYSTATKAVRNIPVVYYSKRLADMGLGYLNFLRGRKSNGPGRDDDGDFPLISVGDESDSEDTMEFIRREMKNADSDDLKTKLLPGFSPFSDNGWRSPFRPHLSA